MVLGNKIIKQREIKKTKRSSGWVYFGRELLW